MNSENNFNNNLQPETLGTNDLNMDSLQQPVGVEQVPVVDANPQANMTAPVQDMPNEFAFNPSQPGPINNDVVNQQVAPTIEPVVPEVQAAPVAEPVVEPAQPVQPEVMPSPVANVEPVVSDNIESLGTTPDGQSLINNDVDLAQLSASVEDTLTQNYVAPSLVPEQVEQPVSTEPNMPIPDTFPKVDSYQAEASTPVDYVAPVSNFDQIGNSPDIDPKAKNGNKKTGKTLTFVLILLAIAALGAGSYYLINVKGILNNKSVVTKNLTVEVGSPLSENINDYATFKNISSSNCVQDLNKVNVYNIGKYTYTIKCGDKSYTGTINVVDSVAPDATPKLKVLTKGDSNLPEVDSLFTKCSEENCVYALQNADDLKNAVQEAGFKTIKVNVSDDAGNTKVVNVPILVSDALGRFAISGVKQLDASEDASYTVKERILIVYTDTYNAVSIKEISFNSEEEYKSFATSSSEQDTITIGDMTGVPVYNKELNKISLISSYQSDLVQGVYEPDYNNLSSNGYQIEYLTGTQFTSIDL